MDYIDDEIDASTVFLQEATELTTARNLDEALAKFGYSRDDRIDKRDLVQIYRKVENAMEKEIYRLAHTSQYDKATNMRETLDNLRAEFDSMQTTSIRAAQSDQWVNFEKAQTDLMRYTKAHQAAEAQVVDNHIHRLAKNHSRFQEIERENLDSSIERARRPRMKYSKRLIELFKAEDELIKLKQYEDARKVRKMIDKIQPGEEARFDNEFDRTMELRRTRLREKQAFDNREIEEKLKAMDWTDRRRRDHHMSVQQQRIVNHEKDMKHSHHSENMLKPEMSVKPSATWQKRPGYYNTSASLRGTQLFNTVREARADDNMNAGGNTKKMPSNRGAAGKAVLADTLVDKHDFFDRIPPDTVTFYKR